MGRRRGRVTRRDDDDAGVREFGLSVRDASVSTPRVAACAAWFDAVREAALDAYFDGNVMNAYRAQKLEP